MLFNSYIFIALFLPVVLVGFFFIGRHVGHRAALVWLVASSFVFYGWGNPRLLLVLVPSIVVNAWVGTRLMRGVSLTARTWLLVLGIGFNLGLLAFFKYAAFILTNVNILVSAGLPVPDAVLPIGISFFTFTQIAYLSDASRGDVRDFSATNYSLFVTFFPHLIAGPIIHHREMMPQFAERDVTRLRAENIAIGMSIFIVGLFKKCVLADVTALWADPVFTAAAAGQRPAPVDAWVGALAFAFQLYFDFSGYSDMAIGLARMFNIVLPLNFDSPYKATNIIEFWRRWHMTLSRFLRDYVYVPLGGNRKGRIRRYVNLLVTMLLGGLWHGAGWTYVIWGALHGFYLLVNHAWHALLSERGRDPRRQRSKLYRLSSLLLTFLAVSVAWVFFRSDNVASALVILKGMIGLNGIVLPSQFVEWAPALQQLVTPADTVPLLGNGTVIGIFEVVELLLLSFVLCWCFPPTQQLSPRQQALALVVGLPFTIQAVLFSHAPSEFIYFQF